MTGLYKRKRDVALIATVNNINCLVEDKPNEKTFVKTGRDDKPYCAENKHSDEKSDISHTKILTNLKGFF